jgi:hypothetical protein
MDPLSISASIAGLLALSGSVIQYLSAIKEAPDARERLLLELSSASGLLYSLKDLCAQNEISPSCLRSLQSLCSPDGPFDQLKHALESLAAKLSAPGNRERLKRVLTWAFDKGEVKNLLDLIERQKSYFLLALQGNHL